MESEGNQNVCQYCGSENIVRGVKLGLTAEAGSVGPEYRTMGILTGHAPMCIDFCDRCGTVVRMYVSERGKKWITRK